MVSHKRSSSDRKFDWELFDVIQFGGYTVETRPYGCRGNCRLISRDYSPYVTPHWYVKLAFQEVYVCKRCGALVIYDDPLEKDVYDLPVEDQHDILKVISEYKRKRRNTFAQVPKNERAKARQYRRRKKHTDTSDDTEQTGDDQS